MKHISVLISLNKTKKAEVLLNSVLTHQTNSEIKINALQNLLTILEKKGRYKEAYETSEILRELSQKLWKETSQKEIALLNKIYETTQRERDKNNLNTLTSNQKLLTSKNRLLAIVSVAIFLLIILVFLLFYKNKLFQSKLTQLTMEQKLLRSKMNPHFIFNSLSNIQSNILQKENQTAIKYLVKFSKLLRYNLEQSTHDTVNFLAEIRNIEDYLDMQNLRLNNSLKYHLNIDETLEQEDFLVPGMMIQPIVENSLEHGLEGRINPEIWITIKDKDNHLSITIEDNGVGVTATSGKSNPEKNSRASEILNRRLKLLSKDLNLNLFYQVNDKINEQGATIGAIATLLIPVIDIKA